MVGTIPKVKKEWDLSFDVKPTKEKESKSRSLVRVTTTTNDKGKDGDRIPALFLLPTRKIAACSVTDKRKNQCLISSVRIPVNKYTSVLVQQRLKNGRYVFSITINGKVQSNRATMAKGFQPKIYENAKVYSGDNFYEAPDAFMKNLDFSNYGKFPMFVYIGHSMSARNSVKPNAKYN